MKVLNLDLEGADLRRIGSGWRGVPWEATRNWRRATFDPQVAADLADRYGAEAVDIDILMLMWEAPPYVAGGTWTACYHLIRRLRRRGAKVTVVVPWEREKIADNPFGLDVPILALGIRPPPSNASAYGAPAWSSYGGAGYSPYNAYGPYSAYDGAGLSGSALFGLIEEFRRRLEILAANLKPDVIHAHDWVTFEAARFASELTGAPWVAHFHSTERDRRPDAPDELTLRIERMGVDSAAALVTPGAGTRRQLVADHGPKAQAAVAIPNLLSDDPVSTREMGRFETRRVVFVGRLSAQKGLDRFGELARAVRATTPNVAFEVFGEGEQQYLGRSYGLTMRGALPWDRRGEAFAGASVLVAPSRSEPFGMVVLEGMQHRTPVIYPAASGAAEALENGVKVDPADIAAMAREVTRLLGSLSDWEAVVRSQATEIDAYPTRPDDDLLIALWRRLAPAPPEAHPRARNGSAG
ncbi:glycosyltransferase family 4 protein [Phenylobacterium sp. LjRoot225]|uniref:glycosyltransferase family 4 protein n=1 Tax=Phenylobacterium sp. LjRoot225 TaxID=3342285 RepID=UPI003ECD1ACA